MEEKKQNENVNLKDKRREVTHDESVLNPQKVHESDLTRKERRLLEKEKIKGMGFKRKLEYLWMYYKSVLVAAICLALAVKFGADWYENSKIENVLTIAVVNAGQMDSEKIEADIKEMLGYTDKYSEVSINTNITTDQSGEALSYYAQMAYIAQLQSKEIDVMVFPEGVYKSINVDQIFLDMKEVLDEETYEAMGDRIQGDRVVLQNDSFDETKGIYYNPVCIAVPLNSENQENAAKWIASLADAE